LIRLVEGSFNGVRVKVGVRVRVKVKVRMSQSGCQGEPHELVVRFGRRLLQFMMRLMVRDRLEKGTPERCAVRADSC
jgi:hypothetical protein